MFPPHVEGDEPQGDYDKLRRRQLVKPLTGAVRALLDRARHRGAEPPAAGEAEPVPVVPGSLGSWADDEVAT